MLKKNIKIFMIVRIKLFIKYLKNAWLIKVKSKAIFSNFVSQKKIFWIYLKNN